MIRAARFNVNRFFNTICIAIGLSLVSGCATAKFHGTSVRCLNQSKASKAILDESIEPYFTQLQLREIETLTAVKLDTGSLSDAQSEARKRFSEGMLSFSKEERDALTWASLQLADKLKWRFPLFADQPWRYLKSANHLCGGWSYTRGKYIVLSQRTLDRIVKQRGEPDALAKIAPLLIHEQTHVVQRLHPNVFLPLYRDTFDLIRGEVIPHPWITTNQISNPDGIRNEWIIALPSSSNPERYFWRRTILKETDGVPKMGRSFKEVVVELRRKGAQFEIVQQDGKPKLIAQEDSVSIWDDRLPAKHGVDHPNEMAAYMFQNLVLNEVLKGKKSDTHPIAVEFRNWADGSL